jgi:hypothetical protein
MKTAGVKAMFAATWQLKLRGDRRRQHERVELMLPVRYMLRDRREYPCLTMDVSPIGLAVESDQRASVGEPVVAYVHQLGRIEGMIVRLLDRGFAVKMSPSEGKAERLAARIAWVVRNQRCGVPDNRLFERLDQEDGRARLTTSTGDEYDGSLLDVSSRGAAIRVAVAPPIGSPVTLDQRRARVVRHFEGGLALAFDGP